MTWQDVVTQKRSSQAEAITQFVASNGITEPQKVAPSVHPSKPVPDREVIRKIAREEISCEALTLCRIEKICNVHQSTNCLTEVCFNDALQTARDLDKYLGEHHEPMGPLHGMVTTLKDQFNVKGYDTTLGYVGRAFDPAQEDATVVKMLKSLGAVILAKTNLPQSIMWCETENPLWGLTINPYSREYTPGGSTGGEAVLIAGGASMLGMGTDIGGSIRIPSHMMGIYGFKPSSARLPYNGVPVSTEGQEHVPSSVGPMARSLDMIHLVMKSLIESKPWQLDSRCVPIPWREDMYQDVTSRPLVIGVLKDDGVARPHPPISRVLEEAVEALRSAGHTVVEWNADLHPECIQVLDDFYTADGGEDIRAAVTAGGEPFIPHVEKLVNRGKPISVFEYWQLNRRKLALQQAYLEKWDSIRTSDGRVIDALLLPPMPHTAVPHRGCRWVGYTKIWNVLDYTALVIPGGTVCEEDVMAPWDFEPRGEVDEWSLDLWKDNREEMARLKLPVGLQIVGRKLEEEKVLGVGQVVENVLRAPNGAQL